MTRVRGALSNCLADPLLDERGGMVWGASLKRELVKAPGFFAVEPEVITAQPAVSRCVAPDDPILATADTDPASIFCPHYTEIGEATVSRATRPCPGI